MPMLSHPFTLYVIAGVMAFIPALIWLILLFKKSKQRHIQLLIFIGSIFSVVPVFLLHYFLDVFPQFDVLRFLQSSIENQNINFILLFISVGIVEEIVKQSLIRFIDKKYLLIQTINDSIHFSLISALSFAFAENIFYIYNIYSQYSIQQLFVAYLFRSVFTTSAHLIFSGLFGYYYGIAKFSMNIVEQSKWSGKKIIVSTFVSKIFGISKIKAYKELTILKGLSIAIATHAIFNLLLQLNQVILVVIFVLLLGYFLISLLREKTGRLILITDSDTEKLSTMVKRDEDVVIELLGMWFSQKRYVDVIHICQRLLERDPHNKVVQLFKAKAVDKLDNKNAYNAILKNIFPTKKQKTIAELAKEKMEKNSVLNEKPSVPGRNKQPQESSIPPRQQPSEEKKANGVFKLNI